jgi:hypothetical protein
MGDQSTTRASCTFHVSSLLAAEETQVTRCQHRQLDNVRRSLGESLWILSLLLSRRCPSVLEGEWV